MDHSIASIKGFFIGSDMYPWYGHLKVEALKVVQTDGHGFSITAAEFSTVSFLTDPDYYKMLQVSFSQVPIVSLDSKNKLIKKDQLLEQSIIEEKFKEWVAD